MSYDLGTQFKFNKKTIETASQHLRDIGERIIFVKFFSEEVHFSF